MGLLSERQLEQFKNQVGLDQLSEREKIILFCGFIFIIGFLIFQFIINPYFDARASLQKTVAYKEAELVEIRQMQEEYAGLRQEEGGIKANLARRPANFTLFTFLDQQAEKAVVKSQINYMKPSTVEGDGDLNESIVEMKLQGITLDKLVLFMRLIESPELVVSLRRVSIQNSSGQTGYLDVILQIVTFVEAG